MKSQAAKSALALAALLGVASAQTQLRAPIGWELASSEASAGDGSTTNAYVSGKDTQVSHSGHASLTIRSVSSTAAEGWTEANQAIRADAYRGKRVRFRGWLKLNNVSRFANLWMRVDSINRQEAFDNMGSRSLMGTMDWKQVSVVLDVPKDAVVIVYGPLMGGTGQMWMDDASLEVVDPAKVATTGGWLGPDFSKDPLAPRNIDFSKPAETPSKLDVPGWDTNVGGWNDAVHRDEKVTRNGKPTVYLHQPSATQNGASIFQEIKAAPYRGKRIEFQAYIKSSGKLAAGPMLAIPGGGQWAVAHVSNLVEQGGRWVPDTREWKPVAAVLDVPMWANCIQLGIQMDGAGQLWVSQGSFRVVDPRTTPVTFADPLTAIYSNEELASLPRAPRNLGFEK